MAWVAQACGTALLILLPVMTAARAGPGEAAAEAVRAPGCPMSDAELEANGARVGEIIINNQNIFDLDDPEEDKALFRTMNRLHVRTRPEVIRQQLLFATGDPYQRRLIDESERILRSTSYLFDAEIEIIACDQQTVDVAVHTRDVWTLQPGIYLSRSGGENRGGIDLLEENFLGRGGSLGLSHRFDEERTSTELSFSHRNLWGRWLAFDTTLGNRSDGYIYSLGVARPFYSLDTRRAAGGGVLFEQREDKVYSLGDEIGRFRRDIDHLELLGGWSDGLQDGWVKRWTAGWVYDRQRFDNVRDLLDPELVPEDRELVYPFVGYELIEDNFRRAANLDQIYRTEDVSMGARIRLRIGLLAEAVGADRNGGVFSIEAGRSYGDPDEMFWSFATMAEGRVESWGLANTIFGGTAAWYQRQSDRRLLFATVSAFKGIELDLDNPLEIGGDAGLRGYPLRYQRGDSLAQLTIEQRYFTDYYLWRLLRVGGAIFFDAGRVWGRDPYGGENLGLLRDIGFGLRLASSRSSAGRMIHVDIAMPLDGDRTIDSIQFLVEGRRGF
jgi:hypothetical protein